MNSHDSAGSEKLPVETETLQGESGRSKYDSSSREERMQVRLELFNNLKMLRRGGGLFGSEIGDHVGLALRVACGVSDSDGSAEIRQKVATMLERIAYNLPADTRNALLVIFGIDPNARLPRFEDRINWIAINQNRNPRTVLRLIDQGIDQIAEIAVSDTRWPGRPVAAPTSDELHHALADARGRSDRMAELKILDVLGAARQRVGDYVGAEQFYSQALTIKEELGDRAGVATSYHQLGILAQSRADYAHAEQFYSQALALNEELGDRAGEGRALNNLGAVMATLGRLTEARSATQKALALSRELATMDPINYEPGIAASLNNLANRYMELGSYDNAYGAANESLNIYRKLVETNPDEFIGDLSAALNNVANACAQRGDVVTAVNRYEEAYEIQQRFLGLDHPNTLTTRQNLAYWRGTAGDPVSAAAALEDLLADSLRILGPDHPNTLAVRQNLALFNKGSFSPKRKLLWDGR